MSPLLTIDGPAAPPAQKISIDDLAAIDAAYQVPDVAVLDPKRSGAAVRLEGLLAKAGIPATARWLTLHSSTDDFHASIPLDAVRERAIVIYRLQGEPLPTKAGGPFRFFIPDFAACHTHDIDECANVKFVDRMEFSTERGQDNRPHDGAEHEALHHRSADNS